MMEKETLEKLREMLTVGDYTERKFLWDVVTALRGPDLGTHAAKNATTGVIRWHVLGPNAGRLMSDDRFVDDDEAGVQHEKYGCLYGPDSAAHLEVRRSLISQIDMHHFRQHARGAFEALGLKWDAVNE